MRVIDVAQGSDEWLAARLGVPSASSYGKLLTPTGRRAKTFDAYVKQLTDERITGLLDRIPQNEAMARGTELEPEARAYYEFMSGNTVVEMGFIKHDTLEAGCSPDGFVGDDGGIEIKCPLEHNHQKTLDMQQMPPRHYPQVQGCMWITGRKWWDFVSYHPEMDSFITRVERDDEYISKLAEAVYDACLAIEKATKEML